MLINHKKYCFILLDFSQKWSDRINPVIVLFWLVKQNRKAERTVDQNTSIHYSAVIYAQNFEKYGYDAVCGICPRGGSSTGAAGAFAPAENW